MSLGYLAAVIAVMTGSPDTQTQPSSAGLRRLSVKEVRQLIVGKSLSAVSEFGMEMPIIFYAQDGALDIRGHRRRYSGTYIIDENGLVCQKSDFAPECGFYYRSKDQRIFYDSTVGKKSVRGGNIMNRGIACVAVAFVSIASPALHGQSPPTPVMWHDLKKLSGSEIANLLINKQITIPSFNDRTIRYGFYADNKLSIALYGRQYRGTYIIYDSKICLNQTVTTCYTLFRDTNDDLYWALTGSKNVTHIEIGPQTPYYIGR